MKSTLTFVTYLFLFAVNFTYAAEVSSISTPESAVENTGTIKKEPIRHQGKTRFNYYNKAKLLNQQEENSGIAVAPRTNLRSSVSSVPNGFPYEGYTKPSGIITTYEVFGNACQFPQDMYANHYTRVAISGDLWANGANCGKCYKIIGKGTGIGTMPFEGEYDVIVTNLCSECPEHHFDVLGAGNGIWDIEYYEQECFHAEFSDPKFKTDGGSQEYMLRFQIIDTPSPVAAVHLTENPAATMEKAWDNFWVYYDPTVLGNQMWQYPVSVTATLENGEQRTGNIYITGDYQDF